jgi:hypothetical protein
MPFFSKLFARWMRWFSDTGSTVLFYIFTVRWANRLALMTLSVVFGAAITVCMTALLGYIASFAGVPGEIGHRFFQGVGMIVPSNAVAVVSCVGAVWIACVTYRFKLTVVRQVV